MLSNNVVYSLEKKKKKHGREVGSGQAWRMFYNFKSVVSKSLIVKSTFE